MIKANVFSYGNKKLPKTIAIFNITTATQCPSDKLGMCAHSKQCYAKRAERLYPTVLPYRMYQTIFFDKVSPTDFVTQLHPKTKYLRISEAGDFRSQSDVNKVSQIAELLKGRIKVYCYTARKDLNFDNVSSNLTVNGSGFMVHNNFDVVKNTDENKGRVCACDCKVCSLCTTRRNITIQVKIH